MTLTPRAELKQLAFEGFRQTKIIPLYFPPLPQGKGNPAELSWLADTIFLSQPHGGMLPILPSPPFCKFDSLTMRAFLGKLRDLLAGPQGRQGSSGKKQS
jgi:hypothetical protein